MLFHLDALLFGACTIAEMAERGRDDQPRHPGVERLGRLTRELDRLRVIAKVKMAGRQNHEVLARARREWAQADRPFGLLDPLTAATRLDQEPTEDRVGMCKARIERDRPLDRTDRRVRLATEGQRP